MCSPTTAREGVLTSLRMREGAALDRLAAALGGQSSCAISRTGTSVPAAKYHEGSASALAEVRRAVQRAGGGPDDAAATRAVLDDIRARWLAQVGTAGRAGRDWTSYQTGGLDALTELEQLVDPDLS